MKELVSKMLNDGQHLGGGYGFYKERGEGRVRVRA
jgi:hypothetical protein